MDSPTWSTYAATWLATMAAIFLISSFFSKRNLKFPRGPKPWPIIGNLNLIGSLPHRSIHQLSIKYGPLMQLHFGSYPFVIASSKEMAKTILKTMDIKFASRPKTAAGKYTAYNFSNILWSPYGPYLRQARKICQMELFSIKRLDSYEYIRVEEINSLVKEIWKSLGKPILLKDYASRLSLNVISRMVLGKRYDFDEEFKEMVDEYVVLNGAMNIGDAIPWVDFLDLQGYVKRMKILSKKFDCFLEGVIDEHNGRRKVEGKNYVGKDMVDVLLEFSDDPNLEVKLERHGVKAFTQDLLAGGTASSATTVEWAISELLKNPGIMKKANEEVDGVIGKNRWVKEMDIPKLPYLQAIVKETMRMHPVAPLLAPRIAREDCQIAGYNIQKGTRVLVNKWTIGRDPKLWDQPNIFSPNRFIGKAIDVMGQDFELLPFGSGRRMCPGYNLGLRVIESSLANLIHGFKWRLPNNMAPKDLDMEEIFGLATPRKIPLLVMVEPRLSIELYSL